MTKQELQNYISVPKEYRSKKPFLSWSDKGKNKFWLQNPERYLVSKNGQSFSVKVAQKVDGTKFNVSLYLIDESGKSFLARVEFHSSHLDNRFFIGRRISESHVHLPCPEKVKGMNPDAFAVSSENFNSFNECFNFALKIFNIKNVEFLSTQENLFGNDW